MNKLIKIEWLKMRRYKAFWWMLGIAILSYPGVNYIFHRIYKDITDEPDKAQMIKMLVGNPFALPEGWHTVAYTSSLFIFIPGVLIIMFITNEYSFRTHRQNIIDGWSRKQFMTAKLIDVIILTLVLTALYVLVTLGIGYVNRGEGLGSVWKEAHYIPKFLLQTFYQLSIAFFIAFLVRKAFIALGIFIFYSMILENILVGLGMWKLNDAGRFLPMETSDRIIPYPSFFGALNQESYNKTLAASTEHVITTIIYAAIIWFLCYRINEKRDL